MRRHRVVLEIDSVSGLLPFEDGDGSWKTYLSTDRIWSSADGFKVTEISREPVKGPKSERQVVFEERVLSLNADIAVYGANHPRVEPDVVCRAALQAVIDEEEAKR